MEAPQANKQRTIGELPKRVSSLGRPQQMQLCRALLHELFRLPADFDEFLLDMQHGDLLWRFDRMDLKSLENALLLTVGPLELLKQLAAFKPQEVHQFVLAFLAQQPAPEDNSAARPPLLAVSLNMDAAQRAASLWEGEPEPAKLFHLDLRSFAGKGRAEPSDLRMARDEARHKILQHGIAAQTGPLDVLGKAQLPLMLWIGWQLRYVRKITAWSDHGVEPTPFESPQTPLVIVPARLYEQLRVEDLTAPPGSRNKTKSRTLQEEACVIIDTSSSSRSGQLNAFYRSDDASPICCARRFRLIRASTAPIQPSELPALLADVLQFLSELRQQGIARIHLGLACRAVVAFFLGQRLNSQVISLYEYYAGSQDRYRYVFDLE
jgi:hypothetical protein